MIEENKDTNTHHMHLNPDPFEKIKNQTKTIELRLYDEKRRQIKPQDIIIFTKLPDNEEQLKTKVQEIILAPSFQTLFKLISPEECGFQKDTSNEKAIEKMREYYKEKDEKEHGTIGIRITKI